MRVENFKCLTCKSMEVCKGYATLKKFDEEYSRNPLPVDISMIDCDLYTFEEPSEDSEPIARDIDV